MMPIEFEHFTWLWALLLVPLVPVVLRFSLIFFPTAQVWISAFTRVVIVLLLILSLASLLWVTTSDTVSVLVLADVSDSAPQNAHEQIEALFASIEESRSPEDSAGLIQFASGTEIITPLSTQPAFPEKMDDSALDGSETDLEGALQVTFSQMPSGNKNRIVLLSDGQETRGDALSIIQRAAEFGFELYSIPYEQDDQPEVVVDTLQLPSEARTGQSFSVSVRIHSQTQTSANVSLYRDGFRIQEQQVDLDEGQTTLSFDETNPAEGLILYELRVQAEDDFYQDNNTSTGMVHVSGEPRILYLEGEEREARYLARALQAENINVDVRPGRGMPGGLDELAAYDAVILSDVPATDISMQQMEILRSYVEDMGGGLIMIGGEDSFGLGGYYRTPVEQILPVRMRSEKKKDTPSLAMMLVIDKSGSMGGEKIELAKEAAIATVEVMGPRDSVGVVAFDGDPYWVVDMQSASNQMGIISTIEQIDAGGGTNIYPAMVQAYDALQQVPATFSHVILLTDGQSQPGDFSGIVDDMVSSNMTVSTVGVGAGADTNLLEDIARWGNGRFYFTDDAYDIPQIFTKETMTASKSSLIEEPFLPIVYRDHPVVRSIDWEMVPFLYGYVVTSPKSTAEVLLLSERGDPLLARWRVGLGQCAAFTSDAKNRWAADWLSWPGYSLFWTQLVRDCMRTSIDQGTEIQITHHGEHARVTIDSTDDNGRFVNQAKTSIQLIRPDLGLESITAHQIAAGRYEAEFPTESLGAYVLNIRQTLDTPDGEITIADTVRALPLSYKAEYRNLMTNMDALEQFATAGGGSVNPEIDELFVVSEEQSVPVRNRLWPWCLALALLLFVVDVALRRIDLSASAWLRSSPQRYG